MKRMFSSPPARELMTRPKSSGGSWRLPDSAAQIRLHRRLKAGSPWPARIHRILSVGLFFAFLGVLAGVWLSVLCCSQSDSGRTEGCFTGALWASGVLTAVLLAKVFMNSTYPRK